MPRQPAVYLLANGVNGTLYLGVTSNLVQRVWQHRQHVVDGFSTRYDVTRLVWFELCDSMEAAIMLEKRMKKWNRAWKIRAIEERNSAWDDLWHEIAHGVPEGLDSRLRGNDEPR
jgi:putative endonuclease